MNIPSNSRKFAHGDRVQAISTVHKGCVGTVSLIPDRKREGKNWVYVQRDDRISPTWFFEDELAIVDKPPPVGREKFEQMSSNPEWTTFAAAMLNMMTIPKSFPAPGANFPWAAQ